MTRCTHIYYPDGVDGEGHPMVQCMDCGIRVYARAANLAGWRNNYCYPTMYVHTHLLEVRMGWLSHTLALEPGIRVCHAYLAFALPWETHWVWLPTLDIQEGT